MGAKSAAKGVQATSRTVRFLSQETCPRRGESECRYRRFPRPCRRVTAPHPRRPAVPRPAPRSSYGWTKFQQTAGVFIGIIVVAFVAQIVLSIIGQASGSIPLSLLLSLAGWIVSLVAEFGMFNAALMVTRGESPTIGTVFQNDRWGQWVGFSIVYGICVG